MVFTEDLPTIDTSDPGFGPFIGPNGEPIDSDDGFQTFPPIDFPDTSGPPAVTVPDDPDLSLDSDTPVPDINELVPRGDFPVTVEAIENQTLIPPGNVLDAVQDTLGGTDISIVAKEAGEIDDVTLSDFLAPYRPEKIDIEKVVENIGETAPFAAIVREGFPGSADGQEVLGRVLPSGNTFNEVVDSVPDDTQIDISQFTTRLVPETDEQINTREALEALGLDLSLPPLDTSTLSLIPNEDFISALSVSDTRRYCWRIQ